MQLEDRTEIRYGLYDRRGKSLARVEGDSGNGAQLVRLGDDPWLVEDPATVADVMRTNTRSYDSDRDRPGHGDFAACLEDLVPVKVTTRVEIERIRLESLPVVTGSIVYDLKPDIATALLGEAAAGKKFTILTLFDDPSLIEALRTMVGRKVLTGRDFWNEPKTIIAIVSGAELAAAGASPRYAEMKGDHAVLESEKD